MHAQIGFVQGLQDELNGHLPGGNWKVTAENETLTIIGNNGHGEEYLFSVTANGLGTISREGSYIPMKAEGNIGVSDWGENGVQFNFQLPTIAPFCFYGVVATMDGQLSLYRHGGE